MRRHVLTLGALALFLVPSQPSVSTARAYGFDARAASILAYSPDSMAPTTGPAIPDGRPTGPKSSPPGILPNNDEDAPEDPAALAVPEEATDVPPARATLGEVRYGAEDLPPAVAATRERLMEAARSGDIEALRPIFEAQRRPPLVAGTEIVDDPVDELKTQSGDEAGREILAILLEVLETGHVHIAADGVYVWPYFAEVPIRSLGARQYVELYRLLTSLDVEELQRIGFYSFYRVGIAEDGSVRYFTAGELE